MTASGGSCRYSRPRWPEVRDGSAGSLARAGSGPKCHSRRTQGHSLVCRVRNLQFSSSHYRDPLCRHTVPSLLWSADYRRVFVPAHLDHLVGPKSTTWNQARRSLSPTLIYSFTYPLGESRYVNQQREGTQDVGVGAGCTRLPDRRDLRLSRCDPALAADSRPTGIRPAVAAGSGSA